MAFADYVCFTSVRLFLLVIVTVNWKVTSSSSFSGEENPTIPDNNHVLKLDNGKMAKMVYKARTKEQALSALEFGHWTWNKTVIVADNYFVIGNDTEKRRFWLKIRKVDPSNAGIYSFVVNGTVVSHWQLQVRKASLKSDQPLLPCGGALKTPVSNCMTFIEKMYPDCNSFPGPPLNVTLLSYIYEGKPVIQVTWEAPNIGYSDLWGYQVYIAGKDQYHAGYYECWQINSKDQLYMIFLDNIKYGATYMITVQPMPANHKRDHSNMVFKDIQVPERCQFPEYRKCCPPINVTAEYFDKKIFVTWAVPLHTHCREINMFIIRWDNLQIPALCHGIKFIEGTYNATILLKEECSRFNYSIKLNGKINKTETRTSKVTVLIPPMIPASNPARTIRHPVSMDARKEPVDHTTKIAIAVCGTFFVLVICTLLVVYKVFFRRVRIKLPDPPITRPNSDQPLLACDSGTKTNGQEI